jgi:hypothetical protein
MVVRSSSPSQHQVDDGGWPYQASKNGEPIAERILVAMEFVSPRSYLARLQPSDSEVKDQRRKQDNDDSGYQKFVHFQLNRAGLFFPLFNLYRCSLA